MAMRALLNKWSCAHFFHCIFVRAYICEYIMLCVFSLSKVFGAFIQNYILAHSIPALCVIIVRANRRCMMRLMALFRQLHAPMTASARARISNPDPPILICSWSAQRSCHAEQQAVIIFNIWCITIVRCKGYTLGIAIFCEFCRSNFKLYIL